MALRRTDARKARTAEDRERARAERERRRGNLAQPPPPDVEPGSDRAQAVGIQSPPIAGAAQEVEPEPPLEEELPSETEESLPGDGQPPHRSARLPVHRPHLHRPHLHRPHLHPPRLAREHLQRAHLPRPRLHGGGARRRRSFGARLGTLAMLALAALAVGGGAYLIARAARHKPAPEKPLATVRVLIPEGSTAAQTAQIARADGLKGDYLKAAASAARPTPGHYGAPVSEHSPEGFLFPATYDMYAGAPVSELVAKQLTAFAENFGSADRARAKALGVTSYQLLIVASMVEREAALEHERPLVAAVIYNRLRRNMPLGIDATIRYALNDYTRPLTEAQLHSSSPYNTRAHTGLPPTPISNPGLASIEAAAKPAHVPYLYYVARADGCPGQLFSSSYAQFERDAAAYQAALRANRGRVPRCPGGK